jgi:alcohol dehydrogenase
MAGFEVTTEGGALAMGKSIRGLSETEAARKACSAIKEMCKDLGIPERLRDVGATEEMLPQMAKACAESGYNKWNPRFTTERDFRELFEKAY